MKILEVKSLPIPDIKVISYARFKDARGYFTETYKKSEFQTDPRFQFLHKTNFLQANESFSKKGTVRGLHFQWSPSMGKLVRTTRGKMVDLVLDIRKGSPTFGKIIGYEMPSTLNQEYNEWIWVPVGFAHGSFYTEDTTIEYYCTSEWSPTTEASISPLAPDIDWSFCDKNLKEEFDKVILASPLITDKDKNGYTISNWMDKKESDNFVYSS